MSEERELAIKRCRQILSGIVDEGTEDTAAWEYRAQVRDAIDRLIHGENITEVMGDLGCE